MKQGVDGKSIGANPLREKHDIVAVVVFRHKEIRWEAPESCGEIRGDSCLREMAEVGSADDIGKNGALALEQPLEEVFGEGDEDLCQMGEEVATPVHLGRREVVFLETTISSSMTVA